jgi:hypothetical protein
MATKIYNIDLEFTLIIVGWFLGSTFENSANSPVKSHGMDFWAASSILWQSCSYLTCREDHVELLFIRKVHVRNSDELNNFKKKNWFMCSKKNYNIYALRFSMIHL